MLLVIDNYDSFTYNLVQYLGEMRVEMQVHRNDQISVEQIRALNPDRILISPGPCSPRESGLSNEIIRTFSSRIPTLGVCLGHQCIGHVFGGNVIVNYRMMHGKTSPIKHNGKDLFAGMPNPFAATRYHSLVIQRDTLPDCLEITAETDEGEIMGVKHKQFPIWGVQFHPESILTENGRQILKQFPESQVKKAGDSLESPAFNRVRMNAMKMISRGIRGARPGRRRNHHHRQSGGALHGGALR